MLQRVGPCVAVNYISLGFQGQVFCVSGNWAFVEIPLDDIFIVCKKSRLCLCRKLFDGGVDQYSRWHSFRSGFA